jgi:hypothetical protein
MWDKIKLVLGSFIYPVVQSSCEGGGLAVKDKQCVIWFTLFARGFSIGVNTVSNMTCAHAEANPKGHDEGRVGIIAARRPLVAR